ncbi:putative quinol monooxygenase [Telluribacter humicola]|uniref:putative quinol monooxygenase n=1 Tax=Telluribacter humicola TaxID=1720261 RepID=UPI001A967203|nr:antibiotic biosynthesis monooxygenase family protein [Telluribacter humicola]
MLIRIVRMTFQPDKTEEFRLIFENSKHKIRARPGCQYLELWQDLHQPYVFVTHSHWESEEALNSYRDSDLFKDTWSRTKALFADKPQAFSVVSVEKVE